jgi:hypothetical protein
VRHHSKHIQTTVNYMVTRCCVPHLVLLISKVFFTSSVFARCQYSATQQDQVPYEASRAIKETIFSVSLYFPHADSYEN